ncbi:MAG: hypothetical protein HKP56_01135 [Anderseniella sp.]|nr:hypothetical protein [Anderseniella sp.]
MKNSKIAMFDIFAIGAKYEKPPLNLLTPDPQALQGRNNGKLAIPSAKISKTISMRQKFLDQRQKWSFSKVSAQSGRFAQPELVGFDARRVQP